jgi:DNA-binding GntR family transcriptional regulator
VPPDRSPQLPSRRVESALRERISAGEWKSGDRLPPVAELAAQYEVARSTVISALRRMDDLVEIVPNWGTFLR